MRPTFNRGAALTASCLLSRSPGRGPNLMQGDGSAGLSPPGRGSLPSWPPLLSGTEKHQPGHRPVAPRSSPHVWERRRNLGLQEGSTLPSPTRLGAYVTVRLGVSCSQEAGQPWWQLGPG